MSRKRNEAPRQSWRESTTFAMRLVAFAVSLAIMGAFLLPWVKLDGESDVRTGTGLMTLAISPARDYLTMVAPIQTVVLIACPVAMLIFAIILAAKYAQRKTALFATAAILASAIAIIYGARGLIDGSGFNAEVGLSLIVILSALLLVHQALIKIRARLRIKRKLPAVQRALFIITGSGHYRYRWEQT